MKSKVSVIVPVYNVQKYLERCLDSLVNQTLSDIEIILVDDGSKDNSGEICDKYEKKYSNIKVIHKENAGLGYARNSGLEVATGEYIAFVDSDDYLDKDFYEKLYINAKNNNSDICFGEVSFLDHDLKEKNILRNPYEIKKFEGSDVLKYVLSNILHIKVGDKFLGFMGTGVWEALYSKKIFDDYNIRFCSEREFMSEDYIFHLDFIPKCKKVTYVDSTYYYHCDNDDSLSNAYREDRFDKAKILYKEMLRKVNAIDFNEIDFTPGVYSLFMQCIRLILSIAYKNRKKIGRNKLHELFNTIVNDVFFKEALSKTKEYDLKVKILNLSFKYKIYSLFYILEFLKNI